MRLSGRGCKRDIDPLQGGYTQTDGCYRNTDHVVIATLAMSLSYSVAVTIVPVTPETAAPELCQGCHSHNVLNFDSKLPSNLSAILNSC